MTQERIDQLRQRAREYEPVGDRLGADDCWRIAQLMEQLLRHETTREESDVRVSRL
jgi:hypothetical protein